MTRSDKAERIAFNAGCEARLRGQSLRSYKGGHLKAMWYQGWMFTQAHYGMEATRLNKEAGWTKWPIAPLPAVGG